MPQPKARPKSAGAKNLSLYPSSDIDFEHQSLRQELEQQLSASHHYELPIHNLRTTQSVGSVKSLSTPGRSSALRCVPAFSPSEARAESMAWLRHPGDLVQENLDLRAQVMHYKAEATRAKESARKAEYALLKARADVDKAQEVLRVRESMGSRPSTPTPMFYPPPLAAACDTTHRSLLQQLSQARHERERLLAELAALRRDVRSTQMTALQDEVIVYRTQAHALRGMCDTLRAELARAQEQLAARDVSNPMPFLRASAARSAPASPERP